MSDLVGNSEDRFSLVAAHIMARQFLLQEFLPDLHQHFQTQSFHTSMYASSWFLTLFATVVPLSVACRVMDLFISEVSRPLL